MRSVGSSIPTACETIPIPSFLSNDEGLLEILLSFVTFLVKTINWYLIITFWASSSWLLHFEFFELKKEVKIKVKN